MTVSLTEKEAFALALIVDFHNKKTNMTLAATEELARRATQKIYKAIEGKKVTISNADL